MKTTRPLFIIVLLSVSVWQDAFAQRLSDPVTSKQDQITLGNALMKKSRTEKAIGYGLLAAGAAGTAASLFMLSGDGDKGRGLFWTSCIAMAASNPVLCGASRNKGRAEMLLMDSAPITNGGDIDALTRKYRTNVTSSSIIAWTMFMGGLVGTISSAFQENDGLLIGSAIAMFGSLPVWMNAAKNKGRLSIITDKQNLLYSFRSGNTLHRSIGFSIPISGNKKTSPFNRSPYIGN